MTEMTETTPGWLAPHELESTRARMPILYVDAVPVRVDDTGVVTHVGLLLRIGSDGTISRMLVSGRVLHQERVRVPGRTLSTWSGSPPRRPRHRRCSRT
jgi:hypothetical protein